MTPVRPGVRGHLVVVAAVAALIMFTPTVAWAHGDEAGRAFDLVRQAIALIVNTPDHQMEYTDKIDDALSAEDTSDVQLSLVQQAKRALAAGSVHQTRRLLERSIGARVHTSNAEPVAIGQPPAVTGEATGTLAAVEGIPGRHGLRGGDWILLAASLAVAALGIAVWARLRPRPSHVSRPTR